MKKLKTILSYLLKTVFSVGIIWFLLHHTGASWKDFAGLSPVLLFLAALAIFIQNILAGVRWYFLMRCIGIHVGLLDAISLALQGSFFNLFIPAGAVSGDIVKAGLLAVRLEKEERFNAVFSILADRICGFAGLLLAVLLTMLIYLPKFSSFPEWTQITLTISACTAVCGLICIVALYFYKIFLKVPLFKWIWNWLDRITKGLCGKVAAVIDLYHKHWKNLLLGIAASGLILFPLFAFAYFFIALTAAPDASHHFSAALLGGQIGEVIGIVPCTPGGIGTRDAAVAAIFGGFGFPKESCSVITTTFTVVMIVVYALGSICLILDSAKKKKTAPANEEK